MKIENKKVCEALQRLEALTWEIEGTGGYSLQTASSNPTAVVRKYKYFLIAAVYRGHTTQGFGHYIVIFKTQKEFIDYVDKFNRGGYREALNKKRIITIRGLSWDAPIIKLTEAEAIEKAHCLAQLYVKSRTLDYLKRHLSRRITGIDLDPIVEQYAQGTPQIMD